MAELIHSSFLFSIVATAACFAVAVVCGTISAKMQEKHKKNEWRTQGSK